MIYQPTTFPWSKTMLKAGRSNDARKTKTKKSGSYVSSAFPLQTRRAKEGLLLSIPEPDPRSLCSSLSERKTGQQKKRKTLQLDTTTPTSLSRFFKQKSADKSKPSLENHDRPLYYYGGTFKWLSQDQLCLLTLKRRSPVLWANYLELEWFVP